MTRSGPRKPKEAAPPAPTPKARKKLPAAVLEQLEELAEKLAPYPAQDD